MDRLLRALERDGKKRDAVALAATAHEVRADLFDEAFPSVFW